MSSSKPGSNVAGEGTSSILQRFLDFLEYVGNKFPSPFSLFMILVFLPAVLLVFDRFIIKKQPVENLENPVPNGQK